MKSEEEEKSKEYFDFSKVDPLSFNADDYQILMEGYRNSRPMNLAAACLLVKTLMKVLPKSDLILCDLIQNRGIRQDVEKNI